MAGLMSSDDPALQPLIVLRVVIRSPDLATFVSKYSRFVKDDRIFIFTKSSQPPGRGCASRSSSPTGSRSSTAKAR